MELMTLKKLMSGLGYSDMVNKKQSLNRPTYQSKLIREIEFTYTGWFIEEHEVYILFETNAYQRWDRRAMLNKARKIFKQRLEFVSDFDNNENKTLVTLKATIRNFERRT